MGKVGFQKNVYQGFNPPLSSQPSQLMERFLLRPQSSASSIPADTLDATDHLANVPGIFHTDSPPQQSDPAELVTVAVLNLKLQALLQDLPRNIAKEVGKIAHELRGEIDHLGEHTDTLETKLDGIVQYVHVLEEENAALKHTVSQIQLQQEDLENRECRQNLRIRGVPETVNDKENTALCNSVNGP